MGQLKFEKDFSQKLNKRKIEPKSGSWDDLSSRLKSDEKSKNPIFWWIGIAASIVGGILIFSGMFSEPISENPVVADAPSEEIFKDESENREVSTEKLTSEEISEPKKASVKPVKNFMSKKKPVSSSELAFIGKPQESAKNKNDQTQMDPGLLIETKVSEIHEEWIAQVSSKENKIGKITDAEVDALLSVASKQINRDKSVKYVSEKINANTLLLDAQMELEQSFREKVFDVLKEGYFKAKTAVATGIDRNSL